MWCAPVAAAAASPASTRPVNQPNRSCAVPGNTAALGPEGVQGGRIESQQRSRHPRVDLGVACRRHGADPTRGSHGKSTRLRVHLPSIACTRLPSSPAEPASRAGRDRPQHCCSSRKFSTVRR